MKVTWEVDEATKVEAKMSSFGGLAISVNGRQVHKDTFGGGGDKHFQLDDGRKATITVKSQLIGYSDLRLAVDGRAYLPLGKTPLTCAGCGATVRSFDRFCDGCGKPLPTADSQLHQRHVREATNVMFVLAGMFVFFGAVMFFVTRSQATDALANIAAMNPDETLELEGQTYSVAELRDQISFEPWDVLITNGLLAVVMIALGLWGRRAPLPAILVATATYAMVIVTNAIIDPASIAQGIIVKVIVIALLIKGIKAGLALRAESASRAAA